MRRYFLGWLSALGLVTVCVWWLGSRTRGQQSHTLAVRIDRSEFLRRRQEWFYRQRADSQGHIPPGARLKALEQLDRMLAAEGRLSARPSGLSVTPPALAPGPPQSVTLSTTQWTLIGPQPASVPPFSPGMGGPVVSGRVTALAVDPRNANVVYLGAAEGGVWKTSDGGNTWTPLTDNQPSLAVGSIALDPSSPDTVYVGTGEENFSADSSLGAGFLKSADGGTTWTQLPFLGNFIGSLAVHPTNSQVLLAGVESFTYNSGVFRSSDGGMTWTDVNIGACTSVLFDPSDGSIAYAAIGDPFSGGGIIKSTDGGATWKPLTGTGANVLPATGTGRIALAMPASSPGTLYASIATGISASNPPNGSSLLGLFKTTDGGLNWTRLSGTPDYCAPACWYSNAIAVQPNNPNVVFAGGIFFETGDHSLVRSTDGGTTWSVVSTGVNRVDLHTDLHALAFSSDGARLYVGNDGGVWSTSDTSAASVNWNDLNSTLAITQFYPGMAIGPSVSEAFGGTQDNGTQEYSGSLTWNVVAPCGDGGWTAIDFTSPSTIYAACAGAPELLKMGLELRKSTSGGSGNWMPIQYGITASDRIGFVPPLVMDPSNSQTLYFGTYRVYQTTDGGGTWAAISPDLTNSAGRGTLTAIAVAPSDPHTVYSGSDDGCVGVTQQVGSGATWRTNCGVFSGSSSALGMAVDPVDSRTVYVTSARTFRNGAGAIYKSTDGGTTWTLVSPAGGNLPYVSVNDIVIDPDLPNTIYIATDIGVFETSDGGATWSLLGSGLPRVFVMSLKLHRPSRTLLAGTHGRSAWDLQLPGVVSLPTASLSPAALTFANQTVGTSSATQTVTLSNTGNAPLAITNIWASGDFAETNTCAASVAAGANCTISVTFTPTAGGSRSGGVTITDNATGSPQSVALSGTGADFTIAVGSGSQASATVVAGGTANYTLALSGTAGFSGTASLACSGAPSAATCAATPASLTLNGTTPVNATVRVSTTARSAAAPFGFNLPWVGGGAHNAFPLHWLELLALALLPSLVRVVSTGWRRLAPRAARLSLAAATLSALLLATLSLPACGGGGTAGGGGVTTGTPAGTYTLTVTATVTSGSATLNHTMSLTLTVN